MIKQPNPEAIAWYVGRAEDLLDDLRERVQSLRSRGGQLAGFSGAVIALVGANAETMLVAVHHGARVAIGVALLAGTILLVLAFVTALRGTLLPGSGLRYLRSGDRQLHDRTFHSRA